MSTLTADPIADAIKLAEQREATAKLLKEQEVAEHRQRREAALQTHKENQERERFIGLVRNMVYRLKKNVANFGIDRRWKSSTLQAAGEYLDTLFLQSDRDLPAVPKEIVGLLNKRFARAIYSERANIPENYFLGQRQEWFATAYAEVAEERMPRPPQPKK